MQNSRAPAYGTILKDVRMSKQTFKIISVKILHTLGQSGQFTCKSARLLLIIQDDFQDFLFSCSKICSKIVQDLSTCT